MRNTRSEWNDILRLGARGILSESDIQDLKSQRARVLKLMMDGKWHPAEQIVQTAGGREGLRRMRELREIPYAEIQRTKHPYKKREFMYRFIYKPGIQGALFR